MVLYYSTQLTECELAILIRLDDDTVTTTTIVSSLFLSLPVQLIKETKKKIDARSLSLFLLVSQGVRKTLTSYEHKPKINTLTKLFLSLLCISCFLLDFFRDPPMSIHRHNLCLSTEGHIQS